MERYKKDLKTYYDMHHPEKNSNIRRWIRCASRNAINHAAIKGKAKRLLDIGCGTGELLRACKEIGVVPYGLDISHVGLLMAKECDLDKLVLGDQEFIPFRNEVFDYVTLISSLEYSLTEENIKKVLHGVRRVVKDEGKVYVEARNGNFILFKIAKMFFLDKLLLNKKPIFSYAEDTVKAKRYVDLSYHSWNAIISESDFHIERIYKFYSPLYPVGFLYFMKSLFVNILNVMIPISMCYRVCYLFRKKTT
ncbi:MAG: class I SAM-dependent methyltransferase [Candidatus Omnitrophica bacterium]|nr:class I SAM-dependent methyltransferase [Candidatus Omnitrophota bacterium]